MRTIESGKRKRERKINEIKEITRSMREREREDHRPAGTSSGPTRC